MKDRKLETGIYRTKYGWRLYARINGTLVPKRITDRDHRLSLKELRDEREALRVDTRREAGLPPPSTVGTFAHDVRDSYLPAVKKKVNLAERTYHMDLWIAEFGDRPSQEIQPWEVAKVRERWLTEGPKRVCVPWPDGKKPAGARTGMFLEIAAPLSARQVNNRLRALENFYTVRYGPHAFNPAREAGEAFEPDGEPRAIDYSVLDAIIASMPDRGQPTRGRDRPDQSLTKLRLRVIAYTGFSHGELAGIEAKHLRLDAPEPWVWVMGRQKGAGTRGVAQPLTPEGAAALRALHDAGGLGSFSPSSMRASWRRACRRIGLTPPLPRPYDARHSFATEVLDKSGSLTALQLNMRHRDARTSRRYAERAIDPARRAGLRQAMDRGAFTGGKVTPEVTPKAKRARKQRRKSR